MKLPVWLYWEGYKPEWIKACHKSIFDHVGNVKLIDPERFDALRDRDREIDISNLCIAHRADFIRAFLLARFGGLWLDSDCIVLKSLEPLINILNDYDFMAFRERQGHLSNSFIGAPLNSKIAHSYYNIVCEILRSGQVIEWLTIGSNALTDAIYNTGTRWYEIDISYIQPVCWSNQEAFFALRDLNEHDQFFNNESFCYMLANSTVADFVKNNPGSDMLQERTFFNFLLKKSADQKSLSISARKELSNNTGGSVDRHIEETRH